VAEAVPHLEIKVNIVACCMRDALSGSQVDWWCYELPVFTGIITSGLGSLGSLSTHGLFVVQNQVRWVAKRDMIKIAALPFFSLHAQEHLVIEESYCLMRSHGSERSVSA